MGFSVWKNGTVGGEEFEFLSFYKKSIRTTLAYWQPGSGGYWDGNYRCKHTSTTAAIVVTSLFQDKICMVNYRTIKSAVEPHALCNPVLSSFITSYARVILLKAIEMLDYRTLYYGTTATSYCRRRRDTFFFCYRYRQHNLLDQTRNARAGLRFFFWQI